MGKWLRGQDPRVLWKIDIEHLSGKALPGINEIRRESVSSVEENSGLSGRSQIKFR
jgi:hypothetical protein